MAQIISRMYPTRDRATAAATALRRSGFSALDVHAILAPDPESDAAAADVDDLVTAIMKCQIARSKAEIYADRVRRGSNLVTIAAPFGSALPATQILDSFDPIDSGVTDEPRASAPTWDEAAPLSSALQLPVLLDDPTPLSSVIGVPTLIPASGPGKTRLMNSPAPLSSAAGLPTLARKAAPFSSLFGLPLLSNKAAPLSSALGLPLGSDKAAPLSSALGWPLLSNNPAPFSSLFRLPVLTKRW